MGRSQHDSLAQRGLLHRLGSAERPEAPVPEVDSVVNNLRAILNSDRGMSPSSPGLGLPLHQIMAEWDVDRGPALQWVAEQIATFEPRLRDVEIVALDAVVTDGSRFRVLIRAVLPSGNPLRLRTAVVASGGANVELVGGAVEHG